MKAHIKNLLSDMEKAFEMGFEDGEAGREKTIPPLPDPSNKRLYASLLLAVAFYEDGYRAGSGAK